MDLNIYSNYVSPIFMSKKKAIATIATTAAVSAAAAALSKDTFTKSENNPNVSDGSNIYTPQELAKEYRWHSKVDRLFKAYANNAEMQQNPHIKNFIEYVLKYHLTDINCRFDQDLLLELLEKNTKNDDENYFKSLRDLSYNDIHPDLIRKIMSNKNYYNKLNHSLVFDIEKFHKDSVNNCLKIFDNYETNYADSEWIADNIATLFRETFYYYNNTEGPVEYANNMMKIFAEREKKIKSETPEEFCSRMDTEVQKILSGEYDDKKLEYYENVYNQILKMQSLMNEILTAVEMKSVAQIYKNDEKLKAKLIDTMDNVYKNLCIIQDMNSYDLPTHYLTSIVEHKYRRQILKILEPKILEKESII